MENDQHAPGRLSVDEFLRLANGIAVLLSGDQAKIDAALALLRGNDERVAKALNQQT